MRCLKLFSLVAFLMALPELALAQAGIVGVVRDTTGGGLPGVTVEAASPALIEKVRIAVTDAEGQYRLTDLRPGRYSVTFSLTGFNALIRDGVELVGSFTATVNAELPVGAIKETLTVTGQAPTVDVQNVIRQEVITSDLLEAIPTGRSVQSVVAIIPGLQPLPGRQDVGGLQSEVGSAGRIHGGRAFDYVMELDGLQFNSMTRLADATIRNAPAESQELVFETAALSAETATGGIRMNVIPKEGGNSWSGNVFGNFSNHSFQSPNLDDALRAQGASTVNALDKMWDVSSSLGGPIREDKLWFFAGFRSWGIYESVAGIHHDLNQHDFTYTPDLSRPALNDIRNLNGSLRLTWQINDKHKISTGFIAQPRTIGHASISGTVTPEASTYNKNPHNNIWQAKWTAPLSSRVLLDVGYLRFQLRSSYDREPGVTDSDISILEQSTNIRFRAANNYRAAIDDVNSFRAAVSYVTGTHVLKVGTSLQTGSRDFAFWFNQDTTYNLLNGIPRSVTVHTTPYHYFTKLNANLGVYAQDQWKIDRLTVNAGLRFDYHNASVPAQHLPATRYVSARDYDEVPDVPNWKDVSPRLGIIYDLFGTSKTALKVTWSRYLEGQTIEMATANNPINTSVNAGTRTWNDLNSDFIPQANELGPVSPGTFGQVAIRSRTDDAVREGFGSRGFNTEMSAGIQHELMPRVSVDGTYFRRSFGNFTVTDNLQVSPADFDTFCITAPVDSRLPGGGGYPVCDLYNISPAKFGLSQDLVTFAKNFGRQSEVYQGVDLTVNARLPRGVRLSGGLSNGRIVTDRCFVVDSPEEMRFCNITPPFQTQFRLVGTVTLPWDIQAAATFQSLPGPEITANYVARNEEIRGSLGRNLSQGANGTVTVPLIEPGTMYGERLYQLDVRLSKSVSLGQGRVRGIFDAYNLANVNPVVSQNNQFGPAWLRPTYVLPGRLLKLGFQVDF